MQRFFAYVLLLAASVSTIVKADLSEGDIDTISENILRAMDKKLDAINDEDSGRTVTIFKESAKEIGQKLGALLKKVWHKVPKEKIKNTIKSTLRDVKESLDQKGKQFVINEGKKQAKSLLKQEVLKFVKKHSLEESCNCRTFSHCGCCIRGPGLEKGCFNMTAIPDEQKFRVRVTYGGEVILGHKISGSEEHMVCTHLPSPLDIAEVCIITQGIEQIDTSNFRSCFRIVSHGIEFSKCILFENGKSTLY